MGMLVRLPDIWWTCSCSVVDPHDNEWIEYCDVVASTKAEAEDNAEADCRKRGLYVANVTAMARPERKVEPPKALPAPAAAAPVRPSTPVPPWGGAKKEPEPDFDRVYFTRYATTTRTASTAGGV